MTSTHKDYEALPTATADAFLIDDFNHHFVIKPIKATIPSYFDNRQASEHLFQLNSGGQADEENDTIVYQPSHPKSQQYYPPPASSNNRDKHSLVQQRYISKKLQDETTSVLCHNSDVIPANENSLLISGGFKRPIYSRYANQIEAYNNSGIDDRSLSSDSLNRLHLVLPVDQLQLLYP